VFADGALSRKHKELTALAVAVSQNCFDRVDHRVEEVLDLGGSDAEIAETLDIGLLMGGTLAAKSVRHAFSVLEQLRAGRT
jgi:AhpD family alkylhydroperoxidase